MLFYANFFLSNSKKMIIFSSILGTISSVFYVVFRNDQRQQVARLLGSVR